MFHNVTSSLADVDTDFRLGIFAKESVRDLVHASLTESDRWEKRRRRLPAVIVVWLTLMLVLHRNKSIPNVFLTMRLVARERWPDATFPEVTNEALCHARSRLGQGPLKSLFEKTAQQVSSTATLQGRPVWVIDGAMCNVPDTPANEARFGRPGTARGVAAFPKLRLMLLTCAATRRIRAVRILGCDEGETTALPDLLSYIPKGDVLMVDRGLAGYPLLRKCREHDVHLVMRVSSVYKPRILNRSANGDYDVRGSFRELIPESARAGRRKTQDVYVEARMVVFRFRDQEHPVRLLTTLPREISAQDIAIGYHIRWEVELGIDELKTHLATVCHGTLHTTFRSKSPALVEQEVYALLTAYNLIRTSMTEAGERHDIDPLDISFVGTLEVFRAAAPHLMQKSVREWPELRERLLKDIASQRIRCPRRPISYPRKVKQKMSNFQVKKPGDKGQPCNFQAEIRLCDNLGCA